MILNKEELQELYLAQKLSIVKIAKSKNWPRGTIQYYLEKYGLLRSREEAFKLIRGPANHNWKGGIRKARKYRQVLRPGHPRAGRNRYVMEHIIVWEEAHSRPLPFGWLVHHINDVKSDNRPENLMGMPRKSHHYVMLLKVVQKRVRDLEKEIASLKQQRRLL